MGRLTAILVGCLIWAPSTATDVDEFCRNNPCPKGWDRDRPPEDGYPLVDQRNTGKELICTYQSPSGPVRLVLDPGSLCPRSINSRP